MMGRFYKQMVSDVDLYRILIVISFSFDISDTNHHFYLSNLISGLSLHPRNQFTSDLVGEIRFLDKADVKNSNKLLSEGGTRVVSFKDMEGVSSLKDVKIQDVRGKEDDFKLDVNGFTYIKQAVKGAKAARDIDQLQSLYEQSAVEIVKKL